MPLYSLSERDQDAEKRATWTPAVIEHFSKPGGDTWTFDYREQLAAIACPTLVTAGDIDPITPIVAVEEMPAQIPDAVKQFEIFADCGHGVHRDDPRAFEVMKKFLAE